MFVRNPEKEQKAGLFKPIENVFFTLKTQQATSLTSAAACNRARCYKASTAVFRYAARLTLLVVALSLRA